MKRVTTGIMEWAWTEKMVILVGANLLLILCAQVRLPLPFTPVPITGQTFGVLLIGALLGSRYGASVVGAYVLEGALGLPVFAGWGGGLKALLGPTGGYLLGFPVAAFVAGSLIERGWSQSFRRLLVALLIADAVIYAFGLPWLSVFVGWERVFWSGLLPFLPGDLLKAIAVAVIVAGVRGRR